MTEWWKRSKADVLLEFSRDVVQISRGVAVGGLLVISKCVCRLFKRSFVESGLFSYLFHGAKYEFWLGFLECVFFLLVSEFSACYSPPH